MSSLMFYLQNWILPMVLVVLLYLIFLIPLYFWAKRKGIGYWPVFWLSVLVIYLIDGVLFLLMKGGNFSLNSFVLDLFFGSLLNLPLLFLPFLIKNVIGCKLSNSRVVLSCVLLFLIQGIYVFSFFALIAAGLGSFF